MPCDDCSRAENCPPCVNEEAVCGICGHVEERHTTSLPEEGRQKYCSECSQDMEYHAYLPSEPKGSDDSSQDDLCQCQHARFSHTYSECRGCGLGTSMSKHQFMPQKEQPCQCCDFGNHTEPCTCDSTKCCHPDKCDQKEYKQPDNSEDECATCGHWRASHTGAKHCLTCHTEDPYDGKCVHKFQNSAATAESDRIERLDLDCALPTGCTDKLKRPCGKGCRYMAQLLRETLPPQTYSTQTLAQQRPLVLVTYELVNGTQCTTRIPENTSIRFTDGSIILTHASPVRGVVEVRSMEDQ